MTRWRLIAIIRVHSAPFFCLRSIKMIKFSEAIRIGAAKRPQTKFAYFARVEINGEKIICSCAQGAGAEGADPEFFPERYITADAGRGKTVTEALQEHFGAMHFKSPTPCCRSLSCQRTFINVREYTSHLNDFHGLSREDIADELERLGF